MRGTEGIFVGSPAGDAPLQPACGRHAAELPVRRAVRIGMPFRETLAPGGVLRRMTGKGRTNPRDSLFMTHQIKAWQRLHAVREREYYCIQLGYTMGLAA